MFLPKWKFLIPFMLLSKSLLASHASFFSLYIPVANPQANLMEKDGIELRKILISSFNMDADISGVTWEHKVNSPDDFLRGKDVNLANIKGLTVEAKNYGDKSCVVTIDSSQITSDYKDNELNKILNYVKQATKRTIKENHHQCKIKEIKIPKEATFLEYPKPLNLEKSAFSIFSSYNSGIQEAPFLHDTFYILGYNKGKIAYSIDYETDPRDMVHIETFIQDLVTDEIVWKHEFKKEDNITNINFKSFWNENHKTVIDSMKDYNITLNNHFSLQTDEPHYRNDTLKLTSKTQKEYYKDWGTQFVKSSTLYLGSKEKGQKIIDTKSYNDSQLLEREILGFLNIEKGNRRIAVIVANLYRGWEGPPHVLGYEIIGASLSVGFKK